MEFLTCVPNPLGCGGAGGCSGATVELAFDYAVAQGVADEWTDPYTAYHGLAQGENCTLESAVVAGVTGYEVVSPHNSHAALLAAVATKGPVAVSVDASQWSAYHGGVFDGCNQETPDLDHAVVLVGYGTDGTSGLDYWLVRNSWGPTWGENGYIRLARFGPVKEAERCGLDVAPLDGDGCAGGPANVTVCGTCGITFDATYPTGGFLY
mmetsp:Transcript_61481/g.139182  ORF Transcript_61481/g.139182 Transcript_61481/m.139182 type:complete len:209 (-) Transcript_61481:32-658(-)